MKKIIVKIAKHIIRGGYSYSKYKGYNVVRSAEGMRPFADWIIHWSKLKVRNIFEIGANFAQDADFLRQVFKVPPEQVYVFEAHPEIYQAVTKIHRFNAYNYAVFNEEKEMTFNIVPLNSKNTGNHLYMNQFIQPENG
jgi:hypothetical protein